MIYVNFCEECGKKFLSMSKPQKFCSKRCRRAARIKKLEESDQPCWKCENAHCGCSWVKFSIPIKGWEAEPTTIKGSKGEFQSYNIKHCPEFIKG